MANSVAFLDEIPNTNYSTSFGSYSFSSSIFDMMMPLPPPPPGDTQKAVSNSFGNSSSGFMDLLAVHDYTPSLFDWLPAATTTTTTAEIGHQALPSPASSNVPDCSEVLNTPASPNSSSISSSSNEAAAAANNKVGGSEHEAEDEDGKGGGEGQDQEDQDKTKKQLKVKKKNQKKQREPRFAFMTKSEVDHLDDGYRWRKYGQKAVKNSPYPRSYYRCTTAGCGVKKRVERSCDDPTIVVTTYEGQHTHPCPATSRASLGFMHHAAAGFGPILGPGGGGGALGSPHFLLPHQQQFQQQQLNVTQQAAAALLYNSPTTTASATSTGCSNVNATSFGSFVHLDDHRNHHWDDNGLLEDIVPTQMIRKEGDEEKKDLVIAR